MCLSLARGQPSWERRGGRGSPGAGVSLRPVHSVLTVGPRRRASSSPVPAGCPHRVWGRAAAARAALSHGRARRGRRTWRRGARGTRARAQLRKRRARRRRLPRCSRAAPRPLPLRPRGRRPASRAGAAGAQRRGRRSRPPWFRSIAGRLTQSAATWPRLAPSPPGAPRPRGSRAGGAGMPAGARPEAKIGEGITLAGGRCG
ncbi:translation initiation factor IF-2-like [Mustela putorius furo]|uniref:Translation initiation factor IF-2-like n=1 Tax=Mustela putorius furo TaxID=9669 RepID=A0A8U0RJ53_MUSPF|nr:translation initiation factor IF-2-like [Mustela putorius furo]